MRQHFRKAILGVVCSICSLSLKAQLTADSIHGFARGRVFGAYKKQLPFWFRSDVYGNKPSPDGIADVTVAAAKSYSRNKSIDWMVAAELNASVKNIAVVEAFAGIRWRWLELSGGRRKEMIGLADSTLSSGSFSVSGNAPGIPQIKLGMPDYTPLPLFRQLLAVKASISYGWIGEMPVQYVARLSDSAYTYFHAGSFYVRIGRPASRLKFYAGGNHEVMWGDEKRVYGPGYSLSGFSTFLYAVIGKTWGGNSSVSFPKSKVGNQLGSVDMGMEYMGDKYSVFLYRQNIYDVGALSKLQNIVDGLNGVRIVNNKPAMHRLHIRKMVFELFYTKNQAGSDTTRYIKSGDENYYNNYFYAKGWSYKEAAIGNPFITLRRDGRATLPAGDVKDYFVNNRVLVLYAGMEGNFDQIFFTGKIGLSRNWGTYGSSPQGHSTGYFHYPPPPDQYFHVKDQVSLFGSFSKQIGHGSYIDLCGALDSGKLLYYNVGITVAYRKTF